MWKDPLTCRLASTPISAIIYLEWTPQPPYPPQFWQSQPTHMQNAVSWPKATMRISPLADSYPRNSVPTFTPSTPSLEWPTILPTKGSAFSSVSRCLAIRGVGKNLRSTIPVDFCTSPKNKSRTKPSRLSLYRSSQRLCSRHRPKEIRNFFRRPRLLPQKCQPHRKTRSSHPRRKKCRARPTFRPSMHRPSTGELLARHLCRSRKRPHLPASF